MLGYFFKGNLGDFIAPRPNKAKEVWSLVKAGLFDQVLHLLRAPGHGFEINSVDEPNGMTVLHYSCAVGNLELVVELLSQGADVTLTSKDGNTCLHYASMNDRKGVVEVLLRSGSDPSLPNRNGTVAVEMTQDPCIIELFMRDRTNIFSPMVQARNLFDEYLKQKSESPIPTTKLPEEITPYSNKGVQSNLNEEYDEPVSDSADIRPIPISTPNIQHSKVIKNSLGTPIEIPILPITPSVHAHSKPPIENSPNPIVPFYAPTPAASSSRGVFFSPEVNNNEKVSIQTHNDIIKAATDTAKAAYLTSEEFEVRRLIARLCQTFNEKEIIKYLKYDATLPMCRLTDLKDLAVTGQTPLHVASTFGNLSTLQLFDELGQGLSYWVVDLQGRTPLHCAAEKGHSEVCQFLREKMKIERNKDPIGINAPSDLGGTTPMGCAKFGAKGKPKPEIQNVLFEVGDSSILPVTPHDQKSGKSPWKLSRSNYQNKSKDDVVYAFAEAQGWTEKMEDRIAISCPLPNKQWSLFAVFDGHGGSYCSEFLKQNIVALFMDYISDEANGETLNELEPTPEYLKTMMISVCMKADHLLKEIPRLKVMRNKSSGALTCLDSSGSTGTIVLISPFHITVGNVGDSRTVLAQRPQDAPNLSDLSQNPFAHSPRDIDITLESTPRSGSRRLSRTQCTFEAYPLSSDHKCSVPEERDRILASGAKLNLVSGEENSPNAIYEVYTEAFGGRLRMSRSFGDFYLKVMKNLPEEAQPVLAIPEVTIHERSARDSFIVMACDGIWDVMSNQQAVDFVGQILGFTAFGGPVGGVTTQTVSNACDLLLKECLQKGSVDNLSTIIIVLGPPPSPVVSTSGSITKFKSYSSNDSINERRKLDDEIDLNEYSLEGNSYSSLLPTSEDALHSRNSGSENYYELDEEVDEEERDISDDKTDNQLYSSPPPKHPLGIAGRLVADYSQYDEGISSPLNTKPGSSKVRKHLVYDD